MSRAHDPDKPPRGHVFGLVYLSHVFGSPILITDPGRWQTLPEAKARLARIDGRLSPTIITIELRKEHDYA